MVGTRSRARGPQLAAPAGHRTARARRAPAAAPQQALVHCDPAFALHASLLVESSTAQPFPFQGEWPEIKWTQDLSREVFGVVAVRVLPVKTCERYGDPSAAFFDFYPRGSCQRASSTGYPCMCELEGQPAFMEGSSWLCQDRRWKVQLRSPPKAELASKVKAVLDRFQGTGSKQLIKQRRAEMSESLMAGRNKGNLPRHAVHRMLCWTENGPPPREGKPSKRLLLQGTEGHNLVCHGCMVEDCLCLAPRHLHWGTPALNATQAGNSRQARKDRYSKNLGR